MLKLEKIKSLPQPKWALVPFIDNPPTIDEYRKKKSSYSSDIIDHGLYAITASQHAIKSWGDDLYLINDPDYWGWNKGGRVGNVPWKSDMKMKINTSNSIWIKSLCQGTIVVDGANDNKIFTFIGVFSKGGSVISFDTLHEEAIDYVKSIAP